MSHSQLDRESVSALVHDFYDGVRADPELGPLFDGVIGDHWEPHLARMVEFWSTVMLGSREFQGNVFGKHMALNGVTPGHFERWLALFEAAARRRFAPAVADEFVVNARRIAASLQYGFFGTVVVAEPAA